MTFADKAIKYFLGLKNPGGLPCSIEIINPYENANVKQIVKQFYKKYFSDNKKRIFVFGINPGRFGGGLTGISFTDPVKLLDDCKIKNTIEKREELSSKFIYKFIDEYGGVEKFYSRYFLSALYPLALIKDGKNFNYYDDIMLYIFLKLHIIDSIKSQIYFGANRKLVICLGKKNAAYLKAINDESMFFEQIITLEHPRYIMQYKSKDLYEYIKKYLSVIK